MEICSENNIVELIGTLAGRPLYSHSSRGLDFDTFPLEIRRLSGTPDRIPLLVRRDLLGQLELKTASRLQVLGQLRSFNNRSGRGARLVLSVYVRQLCFSEEEDRNRVLLCGTLCKPPKFRRTPLGREICDLMLAVNRAYARSDYLPCICWGRQARQAEQWQVGDRVRLEGRLQSRSYVKLTEEGPVEKTAYEVSVGQLRQED